MIRLKVENKDDRENLAVILFRNGYTVNQSKVRTNESTKRYIYYVEIEENKNEN